VLRSWFVDIGLALLRPAGSQVASAMHKSEGTWPVLYKDGGRRERRRSEEETHGSLGLLLKVHKDNGRGGEEGGRPEGELGGSRHGGRAGGRTAVSSFAVRGLPAGCCVSWARSKGQPSNAVCVCSILRARWRGGRFGLLSRATRHENWISNEAAVCDTRSAGDDWHGRNGAERSTARVQLRAAGGGAAALGSGR